MSTHVSSQMYFFQHTLADPNIILHTAVCIGRFFVLVQGLGVDVMISIVALAMVVYQALYPWVVIYGKYLCVTWSHVQKYFIMNNCER